MTEADFKDNPDYADFVIPTYHCYEDDEVPAYKMPDIDNVKDKYDVDTYDQYVGAQVRVPIGDEIRTGKIVHRNHKLDGTVKGRANANSMLDTGTYEIEFPDGRSDEYTTNVIAENMCAQCDAEGNQYNLMESIIDHKIDGHAVDGVCTRFYKKQVIKQVPPPPTHGLLTLNLCVCLLKNTSHAFLIM
jgi:hypothetical protein